MDNSIVDVQCDDCHKKSCAVKLDEVLCDGYHKDGIIGAFTHFHEDHIGAIIDCIGQYDVLITHPITFEGIVALKPGIRHREQWVQQDFDTSYNIRNGQIRLLKANHIPGSSQVYVESDGKTMLYSGDFSFPDMQIKKAEYLVLDATHGDPSYDGKTDRRSVMNRLFEDAKEKTDRAESVVIQTSGGTLQEIVKHFEMSQSDKIADNVSFVMDKKQEKVLLKIYKNDTKYFRDIFHYDSKSREFWKLVNNKPCVIFTTSSILDDDLRRFYKIIIDQYRFGKNEPPIIPFPGNSDIGCRYNLAAHASIENIYSYVDAVNPKYVVTDSSRSVYAEKLAKLIEQKFPNIQTTHRPPNTL